jgi:hypothetical protein
MLNVSEIIGMGKGGILVFLEILAGNHSLFNASVLQCRPKRMGWNER